MRGRIESWTTNEAFVNIHRIFLGIRGDSPVAGAVSLIKAINMRAVKKVEEIDGNYNYGTKKLSFFRKSAATLASNEYQTG